MKQRLLIAQPLRNRRCIAFTASVALLELMLAVGIPVRVHPLRSDQYVTPVDRVSASQFIELGERPDFIYLSTVQFLVSPTGSNQTFSKPSDWTDNNNSVEVIAGGGSGGISQRANACATGAGGGEYGKVTNFTFTGASATYQIGAGGAALSGTVGSPLNANGNNGNDTWWDGTTQAGSTLGAIHGNAGQGGGFPLNGGTGGTGGVGSIHNAGGRGGNITGNGRTSTGGGGAGGTTAAGSNGVDTSTIDTATAGGAGGTVNGGAGGAGSTTNGVQNNGGTGTAWDATHGAGGGGGSKTVANNSAQLAGSGGNYGGGGGGCENNGSGGGGSTVATSGAGANGIIVVSWQPNLMGQALL